ncbi:hypothetical protein [Alysiella crassa]|nr:hypothetical protein [Alysiella crassa]UOP06320.1 hypothetical protein LVJ80_11040 [Alysiella crassa]
MVLLYNFHSGSLKEIQAAFMYTILYIKHTENTFADEKHHTSAIFLL